MKENHERKKNGRKTEEENKDETVKERKKEGKEKQFFEFYTPVFVCPAWVR